MDKSHGHFFVLENFQASRGSSSDESDLLSLNLALSLTRLSAPRISLPLRRLSHANKQGHARAGWLVARRRRGARAEAEASMRRRRRIRRRPLPPPLPRCRPPTSTSCSSTTRGCSGWSSRACCASAATKVRGCGKRNEGRERISETPRLLVCSVSAGRRLDEAKGEKKGATLRWRAHALRTQPPPKNEKKIPRKKTRSHRRRVRPPGHREAPLPPAGNLRPRPHGRHDARRRRRRAAAARPRRARAARRARRDDVGQRARRDGVRVHPARRRGLPAQARGQEGGAAHLAARVEEAAGREGGRRRRRWRAGRGGTRRRRGRGGR